ncbi:MAG: SRPBCC family protein [Gammaproteobacteria bacterium]
MAKLNMQTELNVPLQQVWDLVGSFNALPEWHPAVEHSELEHGGSMRRLQLIGGGCIVEKLEHISDLEHSYSYSIVDSPLPVTNYSATIHLRQHPEDANKTVVEWSGDFNPHGASEHDAVQAIQSIYQAGFDNLQRIFNS